MKRVLILFLVFITVASCKEHTWCDQELRPELAELTSIPTSSNWFEVFEVGEGVLAIAEPYNFQEVISYLIIGEEAALLFDSGMGMASISDLVRELTSLPVIVANSHTHHDHIGGNHQFDQVLGLDNDFSMENATQGYAHETVAMEVSDLAFCEERLPNFDRESYSIKPYSITDTIVHEQIIDLGNRKLQFLAAPGHTLDGLALYDEENGYLWTGDNFYEGPIYLFDEKTDLMEYQQSVAMFAKLAFKLEKVFPGHNLPVSKPQRLLELKVAIDHIMNGKKQPSTEIDEYDSDDNLVEFYFEYFSLLIRRGSLPKAHY